MAASPRPVQSLPSTIQERLAPMPVSYTDSPGGFVPDPQMASGARRSGRSSPGRAREHRGAGRRSRSYPTTLSRSGTPGTAPTYDDYDPEHNRRSEVVSVPHSVEGEEDEEPAPQIRITHACQ